MDFIRKCHGLVLEARHLKLPEIVTICSTQIMCICTRLTIVLSADIY